MALTKEMYQDIFDKIADGGTVSGVCKDFKVDKGQFWRAVNKDDDLYQQYTRARELQMLALADELINFVDKKIDKDDDGRYSSALANDKRTAVDARKWLLSKVLPKIYADKKSDDATTKTEVEI